MIRHKQSISVKTTENISPTPGINQQTNLHGRSARQTTETPAAPAVIAKMRFRKTAALERG
jgi:hypothetical protein